ncbi:MAG: SH3 domain-containing protein [Duganella sp.]
METVTLYQSGAFAAGLGLTLCLAAWLTPRRWWRRPTARGLLICTVGAWGLGSLLLYMAPGAAPAGAAALAGPPPLPPLALAVPAAGTPFQVHRDLNLRTAAGVDAPRLWTVPAGATVIATGRRSGDWWQVTARIDGHDRTGWSSSLWLRRSDEQRTP